MSKLRLEGIAQLQRADIDFGDLTVLVGPQATGKSIALQFLKLLLDTGYIQEELSRYGLDWSRRLPDFLQIFFGEGMSASGPQLEILPSLVREAIQPWNRCKYSCICWGDSAAFTRSEPR